MSEWTETSEESIDEHELEMPDAPILRGEKAFGESRQLQDYFKLEPTFNSPFKIEEKSAEEQADYLYDLKLGYDHLRAAITKDFGLPMPAWDTLLRDPGRQYDLSAKLSDLGEWGENAASRLNSYIQAKHWVDDHQAATEVRQEIPDRDGQAA